MPVLLVRESSTFYRLTEGGREVVLDLAAMAVTPSEAQVEKFRLLIQGEFDTRIKLRDLADGDPRKTTDPANVKEFWEGVGGNKTLVSRGVLVEIRWNSSLGEFEFLFKRADSIAGFLDSI